METGRDSLESYVDAIGLAIRQQSWMKIDKKLNFNVDEGLNETTRLNQS